MAHRESTLAELLADPMTQAVMAADRVDTAELKAMLTALAQKRQLNQPAESRQACNPRGAEPW